MRCNKDLTIYIDHTVRIHWFQSFSMITLNSRARSVNLRTYSCHSRFPLPIVIPLLRPSPFNLRFARFRNQCYRWTIAGARKTIILYGRTGSWVGLESLSRYMYLPRAIAKLPKCYSATGVNKLNQASLVWLSRSSTLPLAPLDTKVSKRKSIWK